MINIMYDNESNQESDDSSLLCPFILTSNSVQRKSQLGKRNKKVVLLKSNRNNENNSVGVKERSAGLRWLRETPSKNIFEEHNTHTIDYLQGSSHQLHLNNNERSHINAGIKKLFRNEENAFNEIFDKNENQVKYPQTIIEEGLTPRYQELILDKSNENTESHDENQNHHVMQNQESDDNSSSWPSHHFPPLLDGGSRKSRLGRRKLTLSGSAIDTTNNTDITDPKEKSAGLKWLRETPHKDVFRENQESNYKIENASHRLFHEKNEFPKNQEDNHKVENASHRLFHEKNEFRESQENNHKVENAAIRLFYDKSEKPEANINSIPLKSRIQINNEERITNQPSIDTLVKFKNAHLSLVPTNNCPNKENQNPIECLSVQKEVEFEKPRPVLTNKPSSNGSIKVKDKSYQILCLLGVGGSSKVYQVLNPENNKILAIKKVDLTGVEKSIADGYLNEVKVLADLQDCEKVIKMFASELVIKNGKKLLYVVMEKGDTDLSKLIKSMNKDKKISPAMIFYYWTEMLSAVNEIHKSGIIHMDLKPANFLLVHGRLKLIDFGIASSIQEDMTSVYRDTATGTFNYMSPEAIGGTSCSSGSASYKITYRSDVWSLGCILYSLVYGKTPYQHITNQWAKFTAITDHNDSIEFPSTDLPIILIDTLKACLKKEPKQRPSVDELLRIPYYNSNGNVQNHSSEIVLQTFTDEILSLVRNDKKLSKAISDLYMKKCDELKNK